MTAAMSCGHGHGPLQPRIAPTAEQSWAGFWYDCPDPDCRTTVLEPSDRLRDHLAGRPPTPLPPSRRWRTVRSCNGRRVRFKLECAAMLAAQLQADADRGPVTVEGWDDSTGGWTVRSILRPYGSRV